MSDKKQKKEVQSKKDGANAGVRYSSKSDNTLLYGKDFYIFMLIGIFLIVLGFFLMAGGHQEPNEWNTNEIYSFRRTALAPIVIVAGLIVEVYAIFKK